MTRNLEEILTHYLAAVGRLDSITLGGEPPATIGAEAGSEPAPAGVLTQEGAGLAPALHRARRSRDRLTVILVVLLIAVFLVSLYLALASTGLTGISVTAGSGALATLLAIIAGLRNLWREKSMLDLLTAVLEESSPERAADLIEAVFWTMFGGAKKGARSGQPT